MTVLPRFRPRLRLPRISGRSVIALLILAHLLALYAWGMLTYWQVTAVVTVAYLCWLWWKWEP